jgi:hypothetical protein
MPTLDDLFRRYDGPVPEEELAAVRAGGAERLKRLRALNRLDFWRDQVRWAVRAVRAYRLSVAEGRRRPCHEHYSRLMADLHSARRQYKAHVKAMLDQAVPPGARTMRDLGRCLLGEAAE